MLRAGSPFCGFPMMRLEEVVETATMSIRTLPDRQLYAEREALRRECAAVLLTLYDGQIVDFHRELTRDFH